jgi:F-type H+-transporting ATPase subunit b
VLRAVVTYGPSGPEVFLQAGGEEGHSELSFADCAIIPDGRTADEKIESLSECDPGPSPIMPEAKELYWGAGAFIVFALLMRFFLYPRLRRSIDARYQSIQDAHAEADRVRAAARAEVADYESALAKVREEANALVDAARVELETERSSRMAEALERANARKDAASSAARAELDAARGQIGTAIAEVASRTVELATGRSPDQVQLSRVVSDVLGAEVSR